MSTVAIISEYNPFHNGHMHQINEIRREFGESTEIVAIMSGNYTQRGELAIADKTLRARAAVECGVNLVLEIPFPFSITSAELYAKSGVRIANAIGVVDTLSFGSELGNISKLTRIAENMLSKEYLSYIRELASNDKQIGYARLCELAYRRVFKDHTQVDFLHPNNILAVEYIKALMQEKSDIRPHTIKRIGAAYSEEGIINGNIQSAAAIRNSIKGKHISANDYMPQASKYIYSTAESNGDFPADADRLSGAVITSFLLNSPNAGEDILDARGGLYNRLRCNAKEATSISELVKLTETKHYTTARIRRSIWFSLFGVTSSEVRALPCYTQILAMDEVGKLILKRIKRSSDFPILTKPSDVHKLTAEATSQKNRSDAADAVFGMALPSVRPAVNALKYKPFVK